VERNGPRLGLNMTVLFSLSLYPHSPDQQRPRLDLQHGKKLAGQHNWSRTPITPWGVNLGVLPYVRAFFDRDFFV
jgi:hypothetical protein